MTVKKIRRLLVANRGEIAIRVFRAATELGLRTVAVYSNEDRFSLHRFKADESYRVGEGMTPLGAYLDIDEIIRVAKLARADAIHPGYGFLSENPDFARACRRARIAFVGPAPEVMERMGNKIQARALAEEAGVPVVPATGPLPEDAAEIEKLAAGIGYPLMLKASWGGGGRGMRVVREAGELAHHVTASRREAKAAFGNDEVYLEKLVERARHVEVQVLGDLHGNLVHLFERDCSIQRRHQKVVERAPSPYLDADKREALCQAALELARHAGYTHAGTVEFLYDADTGEFFFIEVNPRIQVEHTVTEEITGVDLVKAQIRVTEGHRVGDENATGVPVQDEIEMYGHAIQCRITTEDPSNNFVPDYGRISAYRGATGFGIRLDGGTAYSGAIVTKDYDPLLEKVTAWAPTAQEAQRRMDRALREFRIRGVNTNLQFLEHVVNHPSFLAADYTTRFIDETPELFELKPRRDRATRLLNFIADVIVNGNEEVAGTQGPDRTHPPKVPVLDAEPPPDGTRQVLQQMGPAAFARWMLDQERVLVTDTTLRDAHQSLFATRMRTRDMAAIAPAYAELLPGLFSMETWGGATFDVAMRFLREDPWDRLRELRLAVPNVLFQMLLRASNAVGYTNYPDNVVRYFVEQAADNGIDLFRIFDSLNWTENMKVAIDAVLETGTLCEAAICYTGDLTAEDPGRYDLDYYLAMARELEAMGAHIIGIKDMAGLLRPEAARTLVGALKQEVAAPIHLHTHDTSGISAASVLAAVEAGCDAVDGAIDAMSGLTSQPNLGSIVSALEHSSRATGLDRGAIGRISNYFETVRKYYAGFESDIRSGTSGVYVHEMPGGQYTNLRQQAKALGVADKWDHVAHTYAAVNAMFGDIVKVTPSSKVVGDMALMMVTSGLSPEEVADPEHDIAFPESVIQFFRGEMGRPPGGFPKALQDKVLKGEKPIEGRPGAHMEPVDLEAARKEAEKKVHRHVTDAELASHLMYPRVFEDYAGHRREFGDVSVLPTPVFFYGMEEGEEIAVDLERGKTLIVRFLALGEVDEEGRRTVFFELNGQPRTARVQDRHAAPVKEARRRAVDGNPDHVPAPLPGRVVAVTVKAGDEVAAGDLLCSIEAMKMETAIHAERDGTVAEVCAEPGSSVDTKDLLVTFAAEGGEA